MIDTEGLTKRFGPTTAVDGLDLHVGKGEAFGFLGPNGAGKTTTVRMLSGLISKTSGTARLAGIEVGDEARALELRAKIGLLPENVGLYEELSAYRNIEFYGRLYGLSAPEIRERARSLFTMLGLWERRDSPVGAFSKGMKQKVAIARALVHDPPILFLDEPTANLDPEAAKTVRDVVLDLKKGGRTIFLTTHNLEEAQRVCDRVGVLKSRLLAAGTPEELKAWLRAKRTAVRLAEPSETLLEAIRRRLAPRAVENQGDLLLIEVADSALENPDLVSAIVAAGGRIRSVTEEAPSLEEVYLRLVQG